MSSRRYWPRLAQSSPGQPRRASRHQPLLAETDGIDRLAQRARGHIRLHPTVEKGHRRPRADLPAIGMHQRRQRGLVHEEHGKPRGLRPRQQSQAGTDNIVIGLGGGTAHQRPLTKLPAHDQAASDDMRKDQHRMGVLEQWRRILHATQMGDGGLHITVDLGAVGSGEGRAAAQHRCRAKPRPQRNKPSAGGKIQ